MIKQILICLLLTVFLATVFSAETQQSAKVPRIGYLTGATPDGQSGRIESFRQGLRELGYVEGKILSLSIDMPRKNSIASPRSQPS